MHARPRAARPRLAALLAALLALLTLAPVSATAAPGGPAVPTISGESAIDVPSNAVRIDVAVSIPGDTTQVSYVSSQIFWTNVSTSDAPGPFTDRLLTVLPTELLYTARIDLPAASVAPGTSQSSSLVLRVPAGVATFGGIHSQAATPTYRVTRHGAPLWRTLSPLLSIGGQPVSAPLVATSTAGPVVFSTSGSGVTLGAGGTSMVWDGVTDGNAVVEAADRFGQVEAQVVGLSRVLAPVPDPARIDAYVGRPLHTQVRLVSDPGVVGVTTPQLPGWANALVTLPSAGSSATTLTVTGTPPAGGSGDIRADVELAAGIVPVTIPVDVHPAPLPSATIVGAAPAEVRPGTVASTFRVTFTDTLANGAPVAVVDPAPSDFVVSGLAGGTVTSVTGAGGVYDVVVTGTATASGNVTLGLVADAVDDIYGVPVPAASGTHRLTVVEPLVVTSPTTVTATAGTPVSIPLTATTSSAGALTWSLVSGPAWLTIGDAHLVGTPSAAGTHQVVVEVTDAFGETATATITLVVGAALHAPSWAQVPLPTVPLTAGEAFSLRFHATGNPTPQLWVSSSTSVQMSGLAALVARSMPVVLPSGMAFVDNGDGSGTLSGTLTAPGVHEVTVTASSVTGDVSWVLRLEVAAAVPPTQVPSVPPATEEPTDDPTTTEPPATERPTESPSEDPSEGPSEDPSEDPSGHPTAEPSSSATAAPSDDDLPSTGARGVAGLGVAALLVAAGLLALAARRRTA